MYTPQALKGEKTALVDPFPNWKFSVEGLAGLLFKTKGRTSNKKEIEVLRFEISLEKIDALFLSRQICAADIRCLDANSKQCLKKLCLKTCLRNSSLT